MTRSAPWAPATWDHGGQCQEVCALYAYAIFGVPLISPATLTINQGEVA